MNGMHVKKWMMLALILNAIYLVWLIPHIQGWQGVVFYGAEVGLISSLVLSAVCLWNRPYTQKNPKPLTDKPWVDIFVTCYNEPKAMIEKTLLAATWIRYQKKKIFVLDDGHRKEIKKLAKKYHVKYISRKDPIDAKAGNLNNAMQYTNSPFILILDADHVTEPTILDDLLPYFGNSQRIAYITTKQRFDVHEQDFNNDHLFYNYMQSSKNVDGCAISTGSGVIYRRSAIEEIGGFATWNMVEDLTTSYTLNQHGFKSIYINKPYTTGLAPQDLKNIYKQRGTWAVDTLRLFFHANPLLAKKLTWRQRLHYLEMCWSYIVSAIFIPMLFAFPVLSLFTNFPFVEAGFEYILFRAPGAIATIALFGTLNRGFENNQFWIGMWPVYLKSIFLALRKKKMQYKVTEKLEAHGRRVRLILPQLTLFGLGILGIVYNLAVYGFTELTYVNSMWIAIEAWWVHPIILYGLAKQRRHIPTIHKSVHGSYA